ncbi:MarR family transcriptional regulator [Actinoplanes sp. Pm04-4]|jgi:DNA-binding MarR family transcriptional regulator|uniref:MarR family transcriptional regulator n=1 Tax=Paractinoplanes pyxinae TaxID=2997416 RepID=A0ABT4B9Q1_9ACTN|nr:MarR family transcriptional regulator [Actinoplanes pyxinae]MCY1143191.1 MarR family transcriptional regulator [Actinoplanes pyxinae]
MPTTEARFAEASRLAQLLITIADEAKAEFVTTVGAFGLPVPLARVLVLLSTPAPMRDLAEQLHCDRSYITGLADQLEERGLITRIPGTDRRVKLLTLTDAGEAMRDQISTAVAERNMILLRLTDAERRTLAPLLERLQGDPDAACNP